MKFTSLTALLLTGLFGTTLFGLFYRTETNHHAVVYKTNAQVSEEYVAYFCFKESWNATLRQLSEGEITLTEACERVQEASQRHYPNYLSYICRTDPAPTQMQRIALNLLGHLDRAECVDPSLGANIRAVEGDYAVMYGDVQQ